MISKNIKKSCINIIVISSIFMTCGGHFQPYKNVVNAADEIITENAGEVSETTNLVTYDVPKPDEIDQSGLNGKVKYELNDSYTVKVRPAGADDSEWQELTVFKARVQNVFTQDAALVYFDCDGAVEVQVTCNDMTNIENGASGLDSKTVINPQSENVQPVFQEGSNVMSFTAYPNQRLVIDPNGDTRHSLHVFANKMLNMPDDSDLIGKSVAYVESQSGEEISYSYDSDVVIVKPGFYNNSFKVKDNQTWYIDGGAIIRGSISFDNTVNSKVIGHGILYRPDGRALSLDNCSDVYIEGLTVCNYGAMDGGGCLANIANAKNITINNVKSIACNRWSDAIDIFTSEDITVKDCFIRSGDDAIALYGPRWNGKYWGDTGNVRNINVSGCVLMPDRAHPINFAVHGDGTSPNGGRLFDNLNFKDLDLLTYNTYAEDSDGSMLPLSIGFNVCEGNMITNVYFEDIRIQDAAQNKIIDMKISTSSYGTGKVAGRGIDNVYFKDVTYTNPNADFVSPVYVEKGTGMIKNITFENLIINGKVVDTTEEGKFDLGSNVENFRIVKSGESSYKYNSAIVPEDKWPDYYDYTQCENVKVTAYKSENGSDPYSVIDNDDNTVWYSHIGDVDPNTAYSNGDELKGIEIDLGTVRKINSMRITW